MVATVVGDACLDLLSSRRTLGCRRMEEPVPLSEEELRLLEQMERALVEEDPKFASTLRGTSLRRSARRRAIAAGLAFAVGIAVLMTGAISKSVVIGVVGFAMMLASATVGLAALRGQQQVRTESDDPTMSSLTLLEGGRASKSPRRGRGRSARGRPSSSTGGTAPSGSFMERMEQRWRRRRDTNGF